MASESVRRKGFVSVQYGDCRCPMRLYADCTKSKCTTYVDYHYFVPGTKDTLKLDQVNSANLLSMF